MRKLTEEEKAEISTTVAALRGEVKQLQAALEYERAWRRDRERRDDDMRANIKAVILEVLGR